MIELPGYTIEKQLGRGGMARVYLARHIGLDRLVAIKVLSKDLDGDRSFSERFMREARIVANLNHPNIITVHDVGVHDEHHYIAMEYLPGETLDDKIKKRPAIQQTLGIIKQIASALDFAHIKGIVHRDVKPDNILFREDGTAVLTDFGIARSAKSETKMTATGTVIGTPHYMSPEQAQGQEVGPWSDLYSLGIVLFEMINGEVPFDADSTIAVVFKHITEPVPDLDEAYKQYQPLVETLLAKEPSARYQTGREVIADIECLERGDAPANATLIFNQATLGQTAVNPAVSVDSKQTRTAAIDNENKPVKNFKLYAGITIASLLLITAGATLFTSNQPPANTDNTTTNQKSLDIAYQKQELEKRQRELEQLSAENTLREQERIKKDLQQLEILQQENRQREHNAKIAHKNQAKAEAEARRTRQELQALKKQQYDVQLKNKHITKTAKPVAKQTETKKEQQKTGPLAGWLGDIDDTYDEYTNDLLKSADIALANNRYISAEQNYKKVLQRDSKNQRAHKGLKSVKQKMAVKKRAGTDDAYTQDLLKAADNALKTDRLSSASQNYQKVLQATPKNKHASDGLNKVFDRHLQLAIEEAKDNDFDDAAEHFIAAKKLKPNSKKLDIVGREIKQLSSN